MSCAVYLSVSGGAPRRKIKQSKGSRKIKQSKSHEYHFPIPLDFSNQNNQNPGEIPVNGKHCLGTFAEGPLPKSSAGQRGSPMNMTPSPGRPGRRARSHGLLNSPTVVYSTAAAAHRRRRRCRWHLGRWHLGRWHLGRWHLGRWHIRGWRSVLTFADEIQLPLEVLRCLDAADRGPQRRAYMSMCTCMCMWRRRHSFHLSWHWCCSLRAGSCWNDHRYLLSCGRSRWTGDLEHIAARRLNLEEVARFHSRRHDDLHRAGWCWNAHRYLLSC